MKIYDKNDLEVYDVSIDKQTKLTQSLDGNNVITAVFTIDHYIDISIGHYIVHRGIKYSLMNEPSVIKTKSNEYKYNIDFFSPKFLFQNALMLLDEKTDYFLYGNMEDLINHIITNINRVLGVNYVVLGTFPSTKYTNFLFENIDCLTSLNEVIAFFEYEWELSGNTINIVKYLGDGTDPLIFQFQQGLKTIERKKLKENELVTKLYALGSERNTTVEYGHKRLRIDPIESPTSSIYGIIEKTKIWDDLFPHRSGNVTEVRTSGTTPYFYFTDTSMEFDINTNLIGIPAKITFNTGDLQGYEFEVVSYNNSTQEFYLKEYSDETGIHLPNNTFKPSAGDVYIIHDIKMPDNYITAAESELSVKANEFMEYASYPTVIYDVKPDRSYLETNNIEFHIGDTVIVKDNQLGIEITTRITDFTQSLVDEYEYTFKVGNKTKEGFVKQINNKTSYIDSKITSEINNVNVKINHIKTQSIVQTPAPTEEQALIGNLLLKDEAKGLNYVISGLEIFPNYSDNENHVYFEACSFNHFTIDNEIKEWSIPSVLRVLSNPNAKHFIYLRCEKESSNGVFFVSEDVFITDSNSGEYFFLIGVLSAVLNTRRVLNAIFVGGGQTSITNITNVTEVNGTDSAEVIKQKYESNEDTNGFTDAEKRKLASMNQSGNITDISFQNAHIFKADGNIQAGVVEHNDMVVIRMTNTQVYTLIYNTGDVLQLSSYRIIDLTELTLF